MYKVEIHLPERSPVFQCEQAIESAAVSQNLTPTLKSTLQQYPGCIHWHYKRGNIRGVLEITLWPQEARAWISVHDNRQADWIDSVIPNLKIQIERSLYGY